MSEITKIFASYRNALRTSQEDYERLYKDRAKNAAEFYKIFLKELIKPFGNLRDPVGYRDVKGMLDNFLGTTDIDFVAIDGTCTKDAFSDFVVFFGGSYGVKGVVSFEGDPPTTRYHRWSMDKDVSMIAYVPVPFAEITDVADEQLIDTEEGVISTQQFAIADGNKIDLSSIHTAIMQLAEVYLAYDVAAASTAMKPRLILMDHSPSSILLSTDIGVENIGLAGATFAGRRLTKGDIRIAYAHPFNDKLDIPSAKDFRRYNFLLRQISKSPKRAVSLRDLAAKLGIAESGLATSARTLTGERGRGDPESKVATYDPTTGTLKLLSDYWDSWDYVVNFFANTCKRLFKDKDPNALKYEARDPQRVRQLRWMSPNDVKFLIAVGLRALIEKCWEQKILLVGIVKDSASQYLSRNYLGVMFHPEVNLYAQPIDIKPLPWTDRILFETLPMVDDSLEAPWSTVEFDSIFMTLHTELVDDAPRIRGVQGGKILGPERMFLRSLAQFFLSRQKATPLTGHVIFIDRLAFPELDGGNWGSDAANISAEFVGNIQPIVYRDKETPNTAQTLTMRLLDVLTRNLFPEVIGYPDPLHKADWGAKSVLRQVRRMIESSEIAFNARPLAKTLRGLREEVGR